MGFLNWLKGAAGTAARGLSWLGQNVIKPASSFLQQVPIVGDVVSAAEPIREFAQKSVDYGSDVLNDAPNKRQAPTMQEFMSAASAVPKTIMAYKGAKLGMGQKMQDFKQRMNTASV